LGGPRRPQRTARVNIIPQIKDKVKYPPAPIAAPSGSSANCGHVWQRRTDNWRRVTSPERAAKRLKKQNKPLLGLSRALRTTSGEGKEMPSRLQWWRDHLRRPHVLLIAVAGALLLALRCGGFGSQIRWCSILEPALFGLRQCFSVVQRRPAPAATSHCPLCEAAPCSEPPSRAALSRASALRSSQIEKTRQRLATSLTRGNAGGGHRHQWAGSRAVHPLRSMVFVISSARSGVRG
jgi:hypothetical protein